MFDCQIAGGIVHGQAARQRFTPTMLIDRPPKARSTAEDDLRDVEAIGKVAAAPILLQVLCEATGMGFALITCVAGTGWRVCAVEDRMQLGLRRGALFEIDEQGDSGRHTLGKPINFNPTDKHRYRLTHGALQHTAIARYLWVPIILPDGRYFGNLCVIDPRPGDVAQPWVLPMLRHFSQIIAHELGTAQTRERDHVALLDERTASELREQFIAILGHDLRNPLHAVSAIGEVLEHRLGDPVLANMASRIRTNAQRMFSLIDDVLDFAKGRLGGGIDVRLKEIGDLDSALLDVVRELQDGQPNRIITAEINVNCTILCDVGRLQQVVSNLLGNALSHGAADAPVRFTATVDDACLVLEVWNDGDPIPAASIGRIFSPFWRHTVSKNRGGLGLGLHICSQIVRAHHGQISVTSERNTGTTFRVRVPLGVVPYNVATVASGAELTEGLVSDWNEGRHR
jgi:signal transduction histidine kinase